MTSQKGHLEQPQHEQQPRAQGPPTVEEDFLAYTIEQLIPLLRTRRLSPVEITRACLDRIDRLNGRLSAYITVLREQALDEARDAERALARGDVRGPLDGIPVSVKDVFETAGIPTTWGEEALAEYRPAEDSTVVVRLREAGAILLGKTNADAPPTPGSRRLIGPTRNPWNPSRPAGWSSGGSAAAVSALLDYGSIGSDTGGSIRGPAAFCGVVGFKPTFGLVSKHRVLPYSRSFDHCGPLARSVFDCALLLQSIAGHDPKDPMTTNRPVPDFTRDLQKPVSGLRVGLPRTTPLEGRDPQVARLVEDAVRVFAQVGMTVREVALPYFDDASWLLVIQALETAAMAEEMSPPGASLDLLASHMRARSEDIRRKVMDQGMRVAQAAQQKYVEVFEHIDLIVTPTVEITAAWERLDEPPVPLELVANTRLFSFVRCPAISVPCGFAPDGMPVGLQIAGRPFEDELVLRAAHAYERATDWHTRHPSLL